MIINDFEIISLLKKNINIFILLDDSLRSFITFKIIKSFFKKKCIFKNLNEFNDYKYNNTMLILREIHYKILYKGFLDKLLNKNNVIIFILQKINDKVLLKKINKVFKNNCIIV